MQNSNMEMRIQLYRIDRCGFYRRRNPEKEFGSITEWYQEFFDWLEPKRARGVPLRHTSTTGEMDNVPLDIYCIGAVQDGRGNFGVSLFNRGLGEEEGGAIISADASLGNPVFETNELNPGSVTGWLSHFWVIPADSVVVALMPDKARASSVGSFRTYFLNYLRAESSYVEEIYKKVDIRTGNEKPVYCYKDPHNNYAHGVFPSLNVSPEVINTGRLNYIKNSWRDIRSFIMRTETLYLDEEQNDEGVIDRFLNSAIFNKESQRIAKSEPVTMQLDVKWRPESREEVEQVVDRWMAEPQNDHSWAGVLFKNDGKQYKFDVAKCRDTIQIPSGKLPKTRWGERHLKIGWEFVRERVEQLVQEAKASRESDNGAE